jgi:hypothetical protein
MVFVPLLILAISNPACREFGEVALHSNLQLETLVESSGLALSKQFKNIVWTHNDSGDGPIFYAFTLAGEAMGQVELDGVSAADWEGMAIGPCGEQTCLYAGDIGSSRREASEMLIWRIIEPRPPGPGQSLSLQAERLVVSFEDPPFDAEGLAADPQNGDLILIEKSLAPIFRAYRLPADAWQSGSYAAEILDRIQLQGGLEASLVTQADIDPSGAELFIGTYSGGFLLPVLRRDGRISGFDEAKAGPIYGQGQCEAAAYGADGLSLWFTCEAADTPLAVARCAELNNTEPSPAESCSCSGVGSGWWLLFVWLLGRKRGSV